MSNEKQFNLVTKQLVVIFKKIRQVGWGRIDYGKLRNEFIVIKRNTMEANLSIILKVESSEGVYFMFI